METAPRRHGRLNVKINESTAEEFKRLINNDTNATEVVRRAVSLLDFLVAEMAKGKSVELKSADGKTRERVTFFW